MHTPTPVCLLALAALTLGGACGRTTAAEPGEALLGHLVSLTRAIQRQAGDCEAAVRAAQDYLGQHRTEIEALKVQLVERSQALPSEERARLAARLRSVAEDSITPGMPTLMDLGMRCPAQVPRLKEAMSFADIAR